MGEPISEPSFSQWIVEMFDHPVTEQGWWWDLPEDEYDPFPEPAPLNVTIERLERLRRLCEESDSWSAPYSNEQLGQGLWHIFHDINGFLGPLLDHSVDSAPRVRCIRALEQLYLKLFARLCTQTLSDYAPRGDESKWSLNGTCYMLWDIAELHDPWNIEPEAAIDEACLETLRAILRIPHLACQESALHGLGHWHERHRERVAAIVDEFLAVNPHADPELLQYARAARKGTVG